MTDTHTARERLISYTLAALPNAAAFEKAEQLADAYRDQVLTEAAEYLERIADEVEAQVADHYGPASGIGPGSADMVRLAAGSLRNLTTHTPQES